MSQPGDSIYDYDREEETALDERIRTALRALEAVKPEPPEPLTTWQGSETG